MLKLLSCLLLCTGVLAQVPAFGPCPRVEVAQNFDITKFAGLWYEAEKYFTVAGMGAKCITANFTQNTDGTIKIVNKNFYASSGTPSTSEGTAKFSNSRTEGKLNVTYTSGSGGTYQVNYWVLETDNENYSVAYTCTEYFLFHAKTVWILTRKREPTAAVLELAYKVLAKNNLSKDSLIKTDQKECPQG